MSPSEVTVVQSTPVVSTKSPGVRRAVSFRPEDISGPFLQSSTNSTLNLPAGSKAPVSLVHANSCRAAITYDECRKSPPPRPAPPKFQKDGSRPTALSSNSISSHASDHSSGSGAMDSHYLLPKLDDHKETHGLLQPSREAPLPPYACPNKKKQASVDPSPKKMMKPLLDSPDAEQPLLEVKTSAEPSGNQYVNVPSVDKKPEGRMPTLSSFGHQPSKHNPVSENETKSRLKKPCDSKNPSSKSETKSEMKKPSKSISFSSESGTKPLVKKPNDFPPASVSQLKSAFEGTSPNSSSPCPAGNSLSPRRENSLPFRQLSTDSADAGKTPASSVDTPSSTSQTARPKWPAYGRLETTGSGALPRGSPSVVKLQHSASDSVTSTGRRPMVAPKPPPSGLRTSNKS